MAEPETKPDQAPANPKEETKADAPKPVETAPSSAAGAAAPANSAPPTAASGQGSDSFAAVKSSSAGSADLSSLASGLGGGSGGSVTDGGADVQGLAGDAQERVERGADSKKALAQGAKEGIELGQNVEIATNERATQEQRDAATKEGARQAGRLGVKGTAAVAGGVIGESDTTAAAAAEGADAVNKYGADAVKMADQYTGGQLGQQVKQQTGADIQSMEYLSDVPADVVSDQYGQEFQKQGMQMRAQAGEHGQLHEEVQLGAEVGKAAADVAQEKTPENVDKIGDRGGDVYVKYTGDEQTGRDIRTAGHVGQVAVNMADKDGMDSQSVQQAAEVSKEVADRAEEHQVIDAQTNKDIHTGADVVKAGASVSDGNVNPENMSQITDATGQVAQRAQEHGAIDQEQTQTIQGATNTAQSVAEMSDNISVPQAQEAKQPDEPQSITEENVNNRLQEVESKLESEDSFDLDSLFQEDHAHPPIMTQAHNAEDKAKKVHQQEKTQQEEAKQQTADTSASQGAEKKSVGLK